MNFVLFCAHHSSHSNIIFCLSRLCILPVYEGFFFFFSLRCWETQYINDSVRIRPTSTFRQKEAVAQTRLGQKQGYCKLVKNPGCSMDAAVVADNQNGTGAQEDPTRLASNPYGPPIPTIHLTNLPSLDSTLDKRQLQTSAERDASDVGHTGPKWKSPNLFRSKFVQGHRGSSLLSSTALIRETGTCSSRHTTSTQ